MFNEILGKYKEHIYANTAPLEITGTIPKEAHLLLKFEEQVARKLEEAHILSHTLSINTADSFIDRYFKTRLSEASIAGSVEVNDLEMLLLAQREELERLHHNKIVDLEQRISVKKSEIKSKLVRLYEMVEYLHENREKIKILCELNNIEVLSDAYALEVLNIKELNSLLRVSIVILNNLVDGQRGFGAVWTKVLYWPLYWKLDDESESFKASVEVVYFLILCGLVFFTKPYSVALISLGIIVQALYNCFNMFTYQDNLSVAYYTAVNKDKTIAMIDDAILEDEAIQSMVSELHELKGTDLEPSIELATKHIQDEISSIQNGSYQMRVQEKIATLNVLDLRSALLEAFKVENDKINRLIKDLEIVSNKVTSEIQKHMEKCKAPGDVQSKSKIMSLDYKVGAVYRNEQILDYYTVTLPNDNLLLTYKSDEEREKNLDIIRLLLCNALTNVKEKHLYLYILDQENLGRELSDFTTPKLEEYFKVIHTDVDKFITEEIRASVKTVNTLKQMDINEYNSKNEAVGKLTLDYKLYVLLCSPTMNVHKNSQFTKFLKYSAKCGYMFWVLYPDKNYFRNKEGVYEDGVEDFYDFNLIIKGGHPIINTLNSEPITLYNNAFGVETLRYTQEMGGNTLLTVDDAIETNRADVLDYETGYRQKIIPDKKIWKNHTLKGFNIRLGYLDGDPNRPQTILIGDKPVHFLIVGQTGGGKSGLVNNMLASLFHEYSPEWFNLVFIDFKNAEAAMYVDKDTHYAILPHYTAIAGTKDGDYAVSVFNWLMDEQMRRMKHIAKYGFQKIEDYNAILFERREGINQHIDSPVPLDAKIIPRLLALVDEFQVPFKQCSPEIVERLKVQLASLAKESRAAGIHLGFCSQSMAGTLSEDILLQFGLRIALFLDKAVSKEWLGNGAANSIKTLGWAYANYKGGAENYNEFYRIPYPSNKSIKEYMQKLSELGAAEGYKQSTAYFFDEMEEFDVTIMDKYFQQDSCSPDAVMLGERTYLTRNIYPCNLMLTKDTRENILVAATDRKARLNLLNTVRYNIEKRNLGLTLYKSTNSEISEIMGLDTPQFDFIHDDDLEKFINLCEKQLEERKKAENLTSYRNIYFFLIDWDQQDKFGKSPNDRLIQRFSSLLNDGPSYRMHFIVSLSQAKDFPRITHLFKHMLVGNVDADTSNRLIMNERATKLLQFQAYYFTPGSALDKFKLYKTSLDESKTKPRTLYVE